ncbi:MAG TPA: fumarate hydratase [Clostridiales bacterium]|nr:fumarate hydratase [Clostridiales bacterium]
MKIVLSQDITSAIKKMCMEICVCLDQKALAKLKHAREIEDSQATAFALDIMIKNADIAKKTSSPLCQDTGMVVVFVDMGQDVRIKGGYIEDAINQGVKEAYQEGYFRKSVLDPISRENTWDNTPAVIHYNIIKGSEFCLSVMAKGFGSENMSRLFMLTPSEGIEGIKKAVIETIKDANAKPCPPVVVGVGVGGTMEKAALLSKKALFRGLDSKNEDPILNDLEEQLLEEINLLGIGAQGLGGKTTALKVFIEKYPTHIAGLPVAVTVQCHAVRHNSITL